MIIDAHVHIHSDSKNSRENPNVFLKRLITSINKSKIDKAVVLALHSKAPNQLIAQACKKYPRKLIGFASVNPRDKEAAKILEQAVRKYNLKGLKIHPRFQKISPVDKRVVSLVKRAAKLNIPVSIDCFPSVTKDFPVEETFPKKNWRASSENSGSENYPCACGWI
jgi:predicted TIM-barrel fold metal-dependent hydrolase